MNKKEKSTNTLVGPFREILTMRNIPLKGALKDNRLEIITEGGIVFQNDKIIDVGSFKSLSKKYKAENSRIEEIEKDLVALPGFIDAHTHICFAGTRAMDFAARNEGQSYLDIAKAGGGIWSTVKHTRKANVRHLKQLTISRINRLLKNGITTVEIKSGYGLTVNEEHKMLTAIQSAALETEIDVVATCLAAHIVPRDFNGTEQEYLDKILNELVPLVKKEKLSSRFDIFVEESAFSVENGRKYLEALKESGFDITIHGNQFSSGGVKLAIETGASCVEHLEELTSEEIEMLSKSNVTPVVLPGASIGLGYKFAPVRKILDGGCSLVIASDWNPGSAPQGNLLTQASILACYEKITSAEVFAGITFRAAHALGLADRGRIEPGLKADIVAFPTNDYREILYQQGELKVERVWKGGKLI